MRLPLPEVMALETIVADTQLIQAAERGAPIELLERRIQVAADNVRRLFRLESITDIIDDGATSEELLSLKAEVLALIDRNPELAESVHGAKATSGMAGSVWEGGGRN